ncbi:hypothetical protein GOP47_0018877 [Adiantum capillus-veneris]|uniref:EF-hand domain-containing protein n=1 Tax=Adiantum capillus-veneris TaxID=13818 RepID=A0A9D4UE10_ADICA|nr:hypothetical protein GOP47_0018877 [Adiantum capillus-veneris]
MIDIPFLRPLSKLVQLGKIGFYACWRSIEIKNYEETLFESGDHFSSHVEGDIKTSQVIMSQDQSLPTSTILLPYIEETCSTEVMDAEEERRILLAITVEVEDGHLEYIEIRDGDSAEAAATKFCQTHLLPEKYVAPLTEHIVEEVRRISKVDKSIRFASQDGMVYTDEAASSQQTLEDRNLQSMDKPWDSHEDLDRGFESDKEEKSSRNPNRGAHERKIVKSLSESLLSPTFTSLAKSQANQQIENPKESRRAKQLSERAKAVYMRLYGEFLRQKQRIEEEKRWCQEQYKQRIERDKPMFSKKTRRIMRLRGRAAKQFRNYGELLYREGLNKEEERQRLIDKKMQEDEDKELRLLTLKPEISKLAKQIKREDIPVWDRLLYEKPRHDLQGLRQEVWEAKFMECTFRPRVNQRPPEEEDLLHSRFDQLFWDAENRRRRQAKYGQWYPEGVTFRPSINRHHKGSGMVDDHGHYHEGNVFERLMQYAVKLTEKKKRIQSNQESCSKPVDLSTGQVLFKPQTGRKPLCERNAAALPIGDFLYQQKFELENKKKTLAARDLKELKELANGHYVGQRSQQLLNRAKERRLHKIFQYLDKDQDGFVDIDPAELTQLPKEVIAGASEVKHLGTQNKKHVTFSEFLDLLSHVQKKASPTPFFDLRCTKKSHLDSEKFSFQFKMDQNSRSLANRKRRFSSRHQWYKMLLLDRAKWQAKVESLRKEKQKQELAECTFRPSIHSVNSRGHLGLPDSTDSNLNNREEPQNGDIVEKELREVHGFIFQEAAVQKPGLAEHSGGESPLGLLQSFKNIVRNSVQNNGETKIEDKLRSQVTIMA